MGVWCWREGSPVRRKKGCNLPGGRLGFVGGREQGGPCEGGVGALGDRAYSSRTPCCRPGFQAPIIAKFPHRPAGSPVSAAARSSDASEELIAVTFPQTGACRASEALFLLEEGGPLLSAPPPHSRAPRLGEGGGRLCP